MNKYDFDFMLRMVKQADAKVERYLSYHSPQIRYLHPQHTVGNIYKKTGEGYLDNHQKMMVPIGSEPDTPTTRKMRENLDSLLSKIQRNAKQKMMVDILEYTNLCLRLSEETSSETAHWINRGEELRVSQQDKRAILKDYYLQYIADYGLSLDEDDIFLFSLSEQIDPHKMVLGIFSNGKLVYSARDTWRNLKKMLESVVGDYSETRYENAYVLYTGIEDLGVNLCLDRIVTKNKSKSQIR
jgi:hypothetical protein